MNSFMKWKLSYLITKRFWRTRLMLTHFPGNPNRRGRISTVDLFVFYYFISADFFYTETIFFFSYKTSYFIEVVNCTEASPSVSFPWFFIKHFPQIFKNEEVNCTKPSPSGCFPYAFPKHHFPKFLQIYLS